MYRALRRSELPLFFTEGEHPQPRVSFSPALALGVESFSEYLDLWLCKPANDKTINSRLNSVLPDGFIVTSSCPVPLSAPSLEKSINSMEYEIFFPEDPAGLAIKDGLSLSLEKFNACCGASAPQEKDEKAFSLQNLYNGVELEMLDGLAGLRCKVFRIAGSLRSPFRILGELFPLSNPREMNLHIRKIKTNFIAPLPTQRSPQWQTN